MLELVIWYLQGPNALATFARQRRYTALLCGTEFVVDYLFNIQSMGSSNGQAGLRVDELNPVVIAKIRELQGLDECTPQLRQVLTVVEKGALVVQVDQRYDANRLYESLRMLSEGEEGDANI
jgi:hypothetical protein